MADQLRIIDSLKERLDFLETTLTHIIKNKMFKETGLFENQIDFTEVPRVGESHILTSDNFSEYITSGQSGIIEACDFYALMPSDNASTVAPGTDVSFPVDGPYIGTNISRIDQSSFNLALVALYEVNFQVPVTEAGQLILTLDGTDLAYTVVGRATGTCQIVGMCYVQTSTVNSILTVRNPAGNSTALTITPLAGGTRPVSAHLTIKMLADHID